MLPSIDVITKMRESEHWSSLKAENRINGEHNSANFDSQAISHQSCILRYLSHSNFLANCQTNPYDVISKAIKKPVRIHSRITPNSAQFVMVWVTHCGTKPIEFARGVLSYFVSKPKDLPLFAMVGFPSIFRHFITDELLDNGAAFLQEVIKLGDPSFITPFFKAFMLDSFQFINSVWSNFRHYKRRTESEIITAITESIEKALPTLSRQHMEILKAFYEKHEPEFITAFIQEVLIDSFHETMNSFDDDFKTIEILLNASKNPESSLALIIIDSLFSCTNLSLWVPPSKLLNQTNRSCFVMTCHELLTVQSIVDFYAPLQQLRAVKSLMIPPKFMFDIEPVFFDISMAKCLIEKNISIRNLIFDPVDKIKLPENSEFKRRWNQITNFEPNDPLSILTSPPKTPESKRITDIIKQMISPEFSEYCLTDVFNKVNDSEKSFEKFVNIIDGVNHSENIIRHMKITFENTLKDIWQSIFDTSSSFVKIDIDNQTKKKRRCSFSEKTLPEIIKSPKIFTKSSYITSKGSYETPLKIDKKLEIRNQNYTEVNSIVTTVKNEEEDYRQKIHTLLTKCLIPTGRLWIYGKCFDCIQIDLEKNSELSKIFEMKLKTLNLEFNFSTDPFLAAISFFANENICKIYKLKLIKIGKIINKLIYKCHEIASMKLGSASISIAKFAGEVEQYVKAIILGRKKADFVAICSAVIAAAVVFTGESRIYDIFVFTQQCWNNFGEFRTLLGEGNSIQYLEDAMWAIIRLCGSDVLQRTIEASSTDF